MQVRKDEQMAARRARQAGNEIMPFDWRSDEKWHWNLSANFRIIKGI